MHDELYGHLLAALRFGAGEDGCRSAVCIAFEPVQPDGALMIRISRILLPTALMRHPHMAATACCLAVASHKRLI